MELFSENQAILRNIFKKWIHYPNWSTRSTLSVQFMRLRYPSVKLRTKDMLRIQYLFGMQQNRFAQPVLFI